MDRVTYFNMVRDIPYRIPLEFNEADHCCYGKHIMLKKILERTGIKARPALCDFKWSDIQYLPQGILEIPHEDLIQHVFLEVHVENTWKYIDATWDKGLSDAFHINDWDGLSSTSIAVMPTRVYSPEDSKRLFNELLSPEYFEEDMGKSGKFYEAFNNWLKDIRE